MRLVLLCALPLALALAACDEKPPVKESAAEPPAAPATTNAKIEPVPGSAPTRATPTAAPTPKAPSTDGDLAPCGADKAAAFVGRQDRPTTRLDLAKAVGHDNIRWIGPGDAVTMDFSESRLNVMLGEDRRLITGVKCG